MIVRVEPPALAGDTVVFRWTQSEPNRFQRENAFFFRYEGLDLSCFSPMLFYEVFLGLQLKVFAAYKQPVEILFPEPIPRPTAAYWSAFYDADQVTIGPIAEVGSYSPWQSRPPAVTGKKAAVFFGGGKDSMLQTCLFAEIFGPEDVVAIQYIGPLNLDEKLAARLEQRQEALMLAPVRETLAVTTQRVWTDYQAQFVREGHSARPHVELYTVGALPIMLARQTSICTFGYTFEMYLVWEGGDGIRRFGYPKSRPEMLATQTRHYQRVLGADLTVANTHYPFTQLTAFRLLAARYPLVFEHIVMCTLPGPDKRWCYECTKCMLYGLLCLASNIVDPRFDYDHLFARSRYMEKIVAYAESGVERTVFGNAPWMPIVSSRALYMNRCHIVAATRPSLIADRLSAQGMANLILLRSLFGNREFPSLELLPRPAFEKVGHPVAEQMARIGGEHIPLVDSLPGPCLAGNDEASFGFDMVMPTKTSKLAHLR